MRRHLHYHHRMDARPTAQSGLPDYRAPLAITFATSVAASSGSSLLYPVLPVIAADLQINASEIGLVMVAFTSPAVVLAPVLGVIGDRHSRRLILILGLMLYGIAGAACALAPSFHWLLFLRVLQGIGFSAITGLTIILISELLPEEREIHGQGWKVVIDRIAMIGAPILGGFLAAISWRLAFAPFLFCVPLGIAAWLWMPETARPGGETLRQYFAQTFFAMRQPKLRTAFATSFIRFFLDYGLFTYFSLFLALRYGASAATAGWLVALSSVGSIVTAISVGRIHKRMPTERFLVVAFGASALALAILPFQPPLWLIGAAVFVFGMAGGLLSPLQKSLLTRNTQPALRGGVISVDRVIQQVAKSLAPAAMGLLLLVAELEVVFWCLAALSVGGVMFMAMAERQHRV
ncbi:MAG TPA: MFS transporter [Xanthobacteraceae bacterium]|nr:MFS transporter [Xanthobacteraceae bacterium]